jgi:hypothetical protein
MYLLNSSQNAYNLEQRVSHFLCIQVNQSEAQIFSFNCI